MSDLNLIWFILFTVLVTGYAILDGFDLGAGIIQLFTKDADERRKNINACGPVWDGNEVWLLTAGGALFAAFPIVYATVFSGFYLAFMLLLTALIFRAVSFEFRKYSETAKSKKYWDYAFALGSTVPALLYGVAMGNILRGLPVELTGGTVSSSISFLGLLNPYALLFGILSLVMFLMHGAIYMTLKSEGVHRERMSAYAGKAWTGVTVLYFITTFATVFTSPFLFEGVFKNPLVWLFLIIVFAAVLYIPMGLKAKRYGYTFIASSALIAAMVGLTAVSLFPRLVPSSINLANSLTIYNASSTERTLSTMFIIALIGMPLVIIYTIFIYRVFKGKVVINNDSY
jgi:cytochrome d ubiquinol oxidase subunit II